MSDDGYTPLIDREREPKARIHEDLTEPARERLEVITRSMSTYGHIPMNYLIKKIGTSPFRRFHYRDSSNIHKTVKHEEFIRMGDTLHILTYVEMILKEYHKENIKSEMEGRKENIDLEKEPKSYSPTDIVNKSINDIEDVLVTEGILWQVNRLGKGGVIEFVPVGSEGIVDMDEEIQELATTQPWGKALKGYNDAFDQYLNGEFDEHIPKKLYYSIEEVMKIICVDREEWTENRELTHGGYIDIMKENGLYDAHGVTATELSDLLDSLERMVAKVSDERHQRHLYHDRTYATLLIHQVGSYLFFLINRYEEYNT